MRNKKNTDSPSFANSYSPNHHSNEHKRSTDKSHQLKQFYSSLIDSLNDEQNSKEVSKVICKSLTNNENLDYFIEQKFYDKITIFNRNVLDICYIIVSKRPECITLRTVILFKNMLKQFPREVLFLSSLFAQHISEKSVNSSVIWPVLDVTINNPKYFMNDEKGIEYATFLVYLVQEFNFPNEKYQKIWSSCCYLLQSQNPEVVKYAYNALNQIADKISGMSAFSENHSEINFDTCIEKVKYLFSNIFPSETILKHLHQDEYIRPALSLMLHCPPELDSELLMSLLEIARKSKNGMKATLLLLQLAKDPENARILILNSKWMVMSLPTFIDTMKLFMVCLTHRKTRSLFIECPELASFFNNLLKIPTDETLSIVCTLLKRIPLTKGNLYDLSDSNFFSEFFKRTLNNENLILIKSGILTIHFISMIDFIPDFLKLTKQIVSLINQEYDDDLALMASSVAVELCSYTKCFNSFQKYNLGNALKMKSNNPKFKQNYKKFNDIIHSYQS